MLAMEEDVAFPEGKPQRAAQAILSLLASRYGISPLELGSMRVVVPTDSFAWIPAHLFDVQRTRQYLNLVSPLGDAQGVFHIHNKALDAFMVFAADTALVTSFKVAFPGIDVHCPHSVLVSQSLLNDSTSHPLMLLHLDEGKANVDAFYAGKLLLSNSYPAATPDEAMYFAIDIMKRFHLETPDMELRLCGQVDRALYARYQRYFPNVGLHIGTPVSNLDPTAPAFPTYKYPLLLN